jgi:hypothetical protein
VKSRPPGRLFTFRRTLRDARGLTYPDRTNR